ncbi:MAG TPA: hypothetical protein DDW76_27685 [Cyanobacteria bacterium UBA11369]|nr:hypothetical protein [Cyanobacteria bacterium UBA11371]HBE30756.1 hypothetical protein [Cyanobacteria bacterium UBA11368]HBE52449.1 hypothetical protein [Cyanobacteria bacterium UBA11369]
MQHDASYVKAWLKNIESGQLEPPEDFNWLGLAEAAAFNAHSDLDKDSNRANLLWAEIATSVYQRLATEASSQDGESFINSMMMLRAAMIAKFGSVSGHSLLDINSIISWFFRSLNMSYDEAREKAQYWRNCPVDRSRELRRIKNRLAVLSVLFESDQFPANEELNAWLALKERLP